MAIVLTQLGDRTGDARYLDQAALLFDQVSKALPRKRYPEDWAYAQLNLGTLRLALADRGGGKKQLDSCAEGLRRRGSHLHSQSGAEAVGWAPDECRQRRSAARRPGRRSRRLPPVHRGDRGGADRVDAGGISGELGAGAVESRRQPACRRRDRAKRGDAAQGYRGAEGGAGSDHARTPGGRMGRRHEQSRVGKTGPRADQPRHSPLRAGRRCRSARRAWS